MATVLLAEHYLYLQYIFLYYIDVHYTFQYIVYIFICAGAVPMLVNPELDLETMRSSATRTCAMLKALSNPDRLLLLCHISQGESCVSDLEEALDLHQPTLSQQLGVLREEGLVSTRRDGKRIYYSMASAEAMAIMQVLYEQFCEAKPKRTKR
jgi:DNA-binding transcriptional ArsR family regulator